MVVKIWRMIFVLDLSESDQGPETAVEYKVMNRQGV